MARTYTAEFNAITVSVAQDLFELLAGANQTAKLVRLKLGQFTNAGDASAEILPIQVGKYVGASGSGGTTPTAQLADQGDGATGATVEANNTTLAGSFTAQYSWTWNTQIPWEYYEPDPAKQITLRPSTGLCFRLPNAPAAGISCSGSIQWTEEG